MTEKEEYEMWLRDYDRVGEELDDAKEDGTPQAKVDALRKELNELGSKINAYERKDEGEKPKFKPHRYSYFKGYKKLKKVKLFEEFVGEGADADAELIKDAMKSNAFLSLRKPLEAAGFKVDFTTEPHAMYTVKKKGGSKTYAILNKKYVDDADFVHGDIAMGEM